MARHRPVPGRRPQLRHAVCRGAVDAGGRRSGRRVRRRPGRAGPGRGRQLHRGLPPRLVRRLGARGAGPAAPAMHRALRRPRVVSGLERRRRRHRAGPSAHPARTARGDRLPPADGPAGRGPGPSRRPDDVPPVRRDPRGAARRRSDGGDLRPADLDHRAHRRAGRRRNSLGHRERRALRTRPRARRPRSGRGGRREPLARGVRRTARHAAADGGPRRRQEPAGLRAGPDRVRRGRRRRRRSMLQCVQPRAGAGRRLAALR